MNDQNNPQTFFALVRLAQDGKYYYHLYDGDQVLLRGGGYSRKPTCEDLVSQVRFWCLFDFQYNRSMYKDQFLFTLFNQDGMIIGRSEPVDSRTELETLVRRIKSAAWQAPYWDLTVVNN